ncbi:MAG: carboxypeptidase-like regulatory domain-containing protein [Bacteroidetes bacterium]|nr:carboxypeptidase-like regulatory domain-containing protein [Bacteroidota bacterium]
MSAQETIVNGLVVNQSTGTPLPYANIVFKNSESGTISSEDGTFRLTTKDLTREKIIASYLGFETRSLVCVPGVEQNIRIELKADSRILEGIDIVGSKKVRKDTAAIMLYRRVVSNKERNAPSFYDNYSYQTYSKTLFGLYDINEKLPDRPIVRKLPFVFEHVDTVNGVTQLPHLIKETYKKVLYNASGPHRNEVLIGSKISGIENNSLSDLVDFNYQPIDIYKNTININGKPVMSPFANNALLNYKYFLTDTQRVDGYHCYKLQFTGRSSKDNAFTGYAWIHDTTYAIKYIDVSFLPQANINYVNLFGLKQGFRFVDGRYWFKDYEYFQTNMNFFKKPERQGFMAVSESWRDQISINDPDADTLTSIEPRVVMTGARNKGEEFWNEARAKPLTKTEANIYPMVDSILEVKFFKFIDWFAMAMQTRFLGAGPIEIGQFDQFYSYNALEGSRVKFGLRTSTQLSNKFLLGGFGAYGFDDEEWKYGAYFRMHLKRKNELWHLLGTEYKYDYRFVGERDRNDVHDNMLKSLFRSDPINNIFLTRIATIFYEKEWKPGLTSRLDFKNEQYFSVPGTFNFNINEKEDVNAGFTTSELGIRITYGKNLKYFEYTGNFDRSPITSSKPRFDIVYRIAIPRLFGSDLLYNKLSVSVTQRLLSPIGFTRYTLKAGVYGGKVPYPLLELHRGNEAYYLDPEAYNLMKDFEYVSDAYASIWIEHHFNGFLLDKIPGIRYLQLRSIFQFKMVAGRLKDQNEELIPLLDGMKTLGHVYMEIGAGLENILKIGRVDFVYRLTQQSDNELQRWTIKFLFKPSF